MDSSVVTQLLSNDMMLFSLIILIIQYSSLTSTCHDILILSHQITKGNHLTMIPSVLDILQFLKLIDQLKVFCRILRMLFSDKWYFLLRTVTLSPAA